MSTVHGTPSNAPLDPSTIHHHVLDGLGDDDHTQYLLITGSRAMTGGLEISMIAPSITFTDLGGATVDSDWEIGAASDDFVITNLDSDILGLLTLDHIINIRPNPRMPVPNFVGEFAMRHSPTVGPLTGAVQGYFMLQDSATISLGGSFNSYGIISALGVCTSTGTTDLDAIYLFVNNMTNQATLGNNPAIVHSFDSRTRILAPNIVLGTCGEIAALNDWSGVEAIGNGQVALERWITVRASAFDPFFFKLTSDLGGSAVVVNNRIGIELGPITKAGGSGTESILNQYGMLMLAVTNVTTLNCGIWIEELSGAAANYGIVLDSDGAGGGAIWWGAGQDVQMYFSGSAMVLVTDVVAPMDFDVDCGTEQTIRLIEEVWDDARVPLTAGKPGQTRPPTFEQWMDDGGGSVGVFAWAFADQAVAINEEELFFQIQIPHGYAEATDLKAHIHWTPKANGGVGEFVKWGLEYTWQNIDGTFGTTTIITSDASGASTATTSGDTSMAIDKHYVTVLGTISGTGKDIASMLSCRVFRNSSHGDDDYTDAAYALEIDFHHEIDTIGSRQEYSK